MSARRPALAVAVAAASVFAAAHCGTSEPAPDSSVPRVPEEEGLAAFETVRAVLQHPRCANCHPSGDAPLQFDEGLVHGQNVVRGPEGRGVPGFECSTCHGTRNPPASYGPNMPPGAPSWQLPPPEHKMVFVGRTSRELALQLRDPDQTGGKDLAALLDHVCNDGLVLWGWDPGVGRESVPIPHDRFCSAFRRWIDAGAPVPEK